MPFVGSGEPRVLVFPHAYPVYFFWLMQTDNSIVLVTLAKEVFKDGLEKGNKVDIRNTPYIKMGILGVTRRIASTKNGREGEIGGHQEGRISGRRLQNEKVPSQRFSSLVTCSR